jgi:hypothetical protein
MDFEETTGEGFQLLLEQIRRITEAMNEDDPITAITETNILLQSLNPQFLKDNQLEWLLKQTHKLLTDPDLNRLLRLNKRLKEEVETAIEYYDKNIGSDQRLYYQHQIEKDLNKTYAHIRTMISIIIRKKLTESINFT